MAVAKTLHFQVGRDIAGLEVACHCSATTRNNDMDKHLPGVVHTAAGRSSGWGTVARSLEVGTVVHHSSGDILEGQASVVAMCLVGLGYHDMGWETGVAYP